MRELQIILDAWQQLQRERENATLAQAALATVVNVQGSAYRRPGARMLIAADGRTWGGVSGGCLEADVALHAKNVMRENRATVVCYDTRDDADIFFGLGLGCNGVIQILIEPLTSDAPLMHFFAEFLQQHEETNLSTVWRSRDARIPVGTHWFGKKQDEFENEDIQIFHEVLRPSPTIVIFGAGHDALPVAHGAKNLGWRVVMADHRANCSTSQNFLDADQFLIGGAAETFGQLQITSRTGILVMTHNYLHDRELLPLILNSTVPYVGLLGSRRRTEKLLCDLQKRGLELTSMQKARLHAPVGLDIGAETPDEIALAILAEMQTVFAGRRGGFLREQNAAFNFEALPVSL